MSIVSIESCRLQLIVARGGSRRPLGEAVRAALDGGVDLLQVREKAASTAELVALARELLAIAEPFGVPLLINDDVDAARRLQPEVAGVHLGQRDQPIEAARARLGDGAWIGLSTHSEREIAAGEQTTATHFGFGACFKSMTKLDHRVLTRDDIERGCARATRPVFAIGGITAANVSELVALGVRRVAISAAILASNDPGAAAAAIVDALAIPPEAA